ncbi:glycosyltransferase family 4 protein [Pararhizobium mangrovi]|uniref:Glycosyltransferase family 4 protein n=1 Tax=Pararhizobium mangrovi TaxID=2590452 RepID=A0A506UHQ6_9HYPH|nr:glycosyltransferase family 4 protein [Pararhizobium mangrovi]TPW32840.1 glycosyltransferase family 4 protein [Pararhizobium mangrovi]
MRIVQVQTQAEAAGAQRVSDMVGAGLRARGHSVRTVFMYRKTDAYDADPYADFVLQEAPAGAFGRMRAVAGLVRYLRAQKPETVITYQHYGNLFGTFAARLAGVPRIVANQSRQPQTKGVSGLISQVDKAMGTAGLYHANIVNSAWNEAQFAGFPSRYRARLKRIDHGVERADMLHDKASARERFDLPGNVPLAVTTGRLVAGKNQIALLGALRKEGDLHAAIAGVGPDREGLEAFARENGIAERVHFVGELSPQEVRAFLAAGDLYVFASRSESFGLSVVEAAIAGLPIVSSNLDVLREVLTTDDGETAAIFAETNDAAGMAAAIARLRADPALAARLSAAGRRLVERYAPERMCAGYEALLTP